MLKKFLAFFLMASVVSAQTHTIPTTDRNNTWTGTNTFTTGQFIIPPGTNVTCTAGLEGAIQNIAYSDTGHLIGSPGSDQWQQCAQTGASTYAWVPMGGNSFSLTSNEGLGVNGSGQIVPVSEQGFVTTSGVTEIAWSEDVNAGIFDPRNPAHAGGVNGTTPAAAWQATFDAAACYAAQTGNTPQIKMPAGTWSVGTQASPTLTGGPGVAYIGAPGNQYGGTMFNATFLGHPVVKIEDPYVVPVCPNGATNVSDSMVGGYVTNIHVHGCGEGGCSNPTGHSTSSGDGLAQVGIWIGLTQGQIGNLYADHNNGPGVHIDGLDSHEVGTIWSYNNNEYLYFQQNTTGDVYNAATDGLHGNVELVCGDCTFGNIEDYGFLQAAGAELGHLAGILWDGGNSSIDSVFAQLEEIGIIREEGVNLARIHNFRIDGSYSAGILNKDPQIVWDIGEIDGYCLSSANEATTGFCDGIISQAGSAGTTWSNIGMTRSSIFGTSYATGDIASEDGSIFDTTVTVDGHAPAFDTSYPAMGVNPPGNGISYQPPDWGGYNGGGVMTGATPSVASYKHLIMQNGSATNITGLSNYLMGVDYWIRLHSANDTLVSSNNGGQFVTCSGYNISGPTGWMHFVPTNDVSYQNGFTEECDSINQNYWWVGVAGYTPPATDTRAASETVGSYMVRPVAALSNLVVQGDGGPAQTSCYDAIVYVAGGKQSNSPVCQSDFAIPTSAAQTSQNFISISINLPLNWTRYIIFRESVTQSGLSPGTIADVTAPVDAPQVAQTVEIFDTTTATINSNVLGTANYSINMTGTYNIDPTHIPTSASYMCMPGQVKIDPTVSSGAIYVCIAENSWVKAPLTFATF